MYNSLFQLFPRSIRGSNGGQQKASPLTLQRTRTRKHLLYTADGPCITDALFCSDNKVSTSYRVRAGRRAYIYIEAPSSPVPSCPKSCCNPRVATRERERRYRESEASASHPIVPRRPLLIRGRPCYRPLAARSRACLLLRHRQVAPRNNARDAFGPGNCESRTTGRLRITERFCQVYSTMRLSAFL